MSIKRFHSTPHHVHRLPGLVRRDAFAHLGRSSVAQFEVENSRHNEFFSSISEAQKSLTNELRARDDHDDTSLPVLYGYWIYYDSWSVGDDFVRHCRRTIAGGAEQLLLDENALGRNRAYLDIGDWGVDVSHRFIGWSTDTVGDEAYRIFIKDIESGDVVDRAPGFCDAQFEWGASGADLYYARLDDDGRVSAVYRHLIGEDWYEDTLVYEEADEAFATGVIKSRCLRWLMVESGGFDANEIRLVDLTVDPLRTRLVKPRTEGFEYYIDIFDDRLVIVANTDEEFALFRTSVDRIEFECWHKLSLSDDEWLLESAEAFGQHYVVSQRLGAALRLRAFDYHDKEVASLRPQHSFESIRTGDNHGLRTPNLRIDKTTAIDPERTLLWDLKTGQTRLLWEEDAGDDYDAAQYGCRQVFVRSHDSALVPVSVLWRRDRLKVGGNPCLLNVYGAYEDVLDLDFDSDQLSLLNRGVIIANAHVRGGGERGRQWYERGRRRYKINGVIDFVAAARGLMDMGIVRRDGLVAQTDSAGGVIVAAALNEEPQLFAGVVVDVPFVDMIGSLVDEDLPTTIADREEFGDPAELSELRALARISPFDNVRASHMPPVLINTGVADERVPVREPLKWAQRLRQRCNVNVLIHVDTQSGHHGSMGRYQQIHSLAQQQAFVLHCMGIGGRATKS